MTTSYRRPLYGFRFVETRHGDTLQAIAARELGDASRWSEIIAHNDLVPPFITDDPAEAREGVVLTGSKIRLPAPTPMVSAALDPDRVFGRDVRLHNGVLDAAGGDFAVIAGRENLRQALRHRIETDRGEVLFHREYGSRVRELMGAVSGPTALMLAAEYAKSAVAADPRIEEVTRAVAETSGDVTRVSVEARPVTGRDPMEIEATL